MTSATLTPICSLSARAPLPISDGEATSAMSSLKAMPRRQKPNSIASEASYHLPPRALMPTEAVEPHSDVAAIRGMSPVHCLRQSSEPNVTGAEAIGGLSPSPRLPSAFGHTVAVIRELHRQRQDLLRTEGDLTRRLRALCRRAVGYNPFAPAKERAQKMAQANVLYKEIQRRSGQEAGDTQFIAAAADAEPFPDDVEGQADADTQGVCADDIITPVTASSPSIVFAAPSLVIAESMIRKQRLIVERMMKKHTETLPVCISFVQLVNGFGALGLSQIIGEAGDLSLYANPAKLWKRMGLGLVDGEKQGKHTDAAKALAHGYSPRRRSTMYSIGDSLIKKQNPYRELYLQRKVYETEKAEAQGLTVCAADKIPKGMTAQVMTIMHIHRRAQRYMEKRLLRDLWRAWRMDTGAAP